MGRELSFDPFPFISNPHHQTILAAFFNFLSEPESKEWSIRLSDGDRLSVQISTPPNWKSTDPTIVVVHGLCGSHRSPQVVRTLNRLYPRGYRVVRFNMRGCGSGKGFAKNCYHCGKSDDLFEVVWRLHQESPDSPILLCGFSLGGNVVIKMAGELGNLGNRYLSGVIAVNPPVDLYSSVQMLGMPSNSLYEKYFYKLLRADVHFRQSQFRDLPQVNLPKELKIYEFDQTYTAPINGFKSAIDYYQKCSSIHVVEDIAVPTRILLSEDDPIISSTSLDSLNLPNHIHLYKTKQGGHLGYIGHPSSPGGFYWLDSILETWVTEIIEAP